MKSYWSDPLLWMVLCCCSYGCQESPPAAPAAPVAAPSTTAVEVKSEPGKVELSKATAFIDDGNIVRFEVSYRFTAGSPVKNYMCEFTFPGTNERGMKPLDPWEVKPEGVIKTGIQVSDPAVKEFEVTFSEADSPQFGYTLISNTLKGEILPAPAQK